MCEISSTLTIKTPEQRQRRRSGVFIVSFEHVSHLVIVFQSNKFKPNKTINPFHATSFLLYPLKMSENL